MTRILLASPRWRSVHPCAEDFAFDICAAADPSISLGRVPGGALTGCAVDSARESVCALGIKAGYDVVLFCDADARLNAEQAIDMARRAIRYDYAILAAPVKLRGNLGMGFSLTIWNGREEPPPTAEQAKRLLTCIRNRECWATDGHVATTVCVVNLKHLHDIPRPWFLREPDERARIVTAKAPAEPPTSDDVWFCIRAHRAGKKVGIDFAARDTEHWTSLKLEGGPALDGLEKYLEKKIPLMEADEKPPEVPAAPTDPGLRIVR